MANITSFFFPQTNGLTQRMEASQTTKQNPAQNPAMKNQQFSAEFFALLQGEISALTSSGQGEITPRDIKNMSDEQIEMLGNFLGNIEVGENGEIIYSSPAEGSFREPLDILPQSLADIDITTATENDPAVLDALERIRASVLTTGENAGKSSEHGRMTAFEKLGAVIEQFLGGIPQESRQIQSELAAMNADATAIAVDSNGDTEEPAILQIQGGTVTKEELKAELIATGLTPEKITQLLEKLADMKDAQNNKTADAALEGDVTFTLVTPSKATPAAEEQNVIFLPRGIVVSENTSRNEHRTTRAGENVARALNKALENLVTQGNMNGLYGDEAAQNVNGGKTGESSFDRVFSMFKEAKADYQSNPAGKIQDGADKSTTLTANQLPTHAEAKAAAKLSAGLSTIQFNQQQALQNLSSSGAWDAVYPEGFDWATAPGTQSSPNNSVQLATMTSLVSQNNAATATHPATQMVAATITKAGQSDSKMLTLRLDPPDLGRVQVRMELTEDNVVKAIISSEKPQTHMMLQRDAHALERALQNAGLDTAGGSLEFELSEDGSLFGDNDGRGGDNDSGSGSSSGGESDDHNGALIESTMTWQLDPETGYMHYNLIV